MITATGHEVLSDEFVKLGFDMRTFLGEVSLSRTYQRSIDLLARAKQLGMKTKSGLIVGMGETLDEAREVMRDLRTVHCDIITIGQYLQPTRDHLPVARFYDPSEFALLKGEGLAMGFSHVESGPLVRSSYHAEQAAG